MEQATLPRTSPASHAGFPPGHRLPSWAQAALYARDPLGFVSGLQRRYGDVFTITFPFFGRLVCLASPPLVKELYTGSPSQIHAGEAIASILGPVIGSNSVLMLDEAPHLRQRKLLLPAFHGKQVQRFGDLIREVTLEEIQSWPVGKPFALRPHTQRITLALIMKAVFGVHDERRLARFEDLLEDFSAQVNVVTTLPVLRRNLGRWSPGGRFLRARAALDRFIYEEITLRRAEIAGEEEERDDVLSRLLSARDEDGALMSDEELRDELVTILAAGHETTATGLAWTVERLLRTPRAMDRLQESIAAGEDEYLDAAIKEALRMRPVITLSVRKLVEPLSFGGYDLPAGTFVLAAIAALHYREDLFPNPLEFRPERFLDGKPDTYAWVPFGGGVRRCIGAAFAEYEMRVVLRTIFERAELSAPDLKPEKVKLRNITLSPGKGTQVVLARPLADLG
jgi:cytochrome P450